VARIRSLKPDFFDHEELARTSPHARLAFQGLWLHADRDGRLSDEPGRLRVRVFPYETTIDMNALIEELRAIGVIVRYTVEGESYIAIPGFLEHQRPHPKEPSRGIPPPSREQITASRGKKLQNTAQPRLDESRDQTRQAVERNICAVMRSVDPDPDLGTDQERERHPSPPPQSRPIVKARAPWACWEGQRLQVPQKWHDDHVRMLGGQQAAERLVAWYRELDAELQRTGMPVGNVFTWLNRRYERWVASSVPDEDPLAAAEAIHARMLRESEERRASLRKEPGR
jgi:hypothetical protein